eukprot:TRINITY_DN2248_c0_g1_i5.p1 TRINITY_DN2248_c0_g1~~TRINITY_DN2248_c0_g1_i5.p1  ORF type:complete len:447 (+),score=119.24 TRINITY_DN2248_c0_g1_i5:230-1570(+)
MLVSLVISSATFFVSLHTIYWSCCLLFGTPLAQPTLRTVWQQTFLAIRGESQYIGAENWARYRRSVLFGIASHLIVWRPVFGVLLFTDQVLLSTRYMGQQIRKPMFVVSASRSGSTNLGHLLDYDPSLCGPPALFNVLPFLSVWMVLNSTLGRFISGERLNRFLKGLAPEEMKVRHEMNPMKPDTLDGTFAFRQWWSDVYCSIMFTHPVNKDKDTGRVFYWQLDTNEQDRAIGLLDELAKKWLWWCDADANQQHLLIKSHTVCMVPALQAKYPDAAFVTVLRDPIQMVSSIVPFANDEERWGVSSVDWDWYNLSALKFYKQYCDQEVALVQGEHPVMLGVAFMTMVTDTGATVQAINNWTAAKWGQKPVLYKGSEHEAAVVQAEQQPECVADKAWRKKMKSKYPNQPVATLLKLAAAGAQRLGVEQFDEEVAFSEHRKHTASLLSK